MPRIAFQALAILLGTVLSAGVALAYEPTGRCIDGVQWFFQTDAEIAVATVAPCSAPFEGYATLACRPGSGMVTLSLNIPFRAAVGAPIEVALGIDGAVTRLTGTGIANAYLGATSFQADIPPQSPLLERIAAGRVLTVDTADGIPVAGLHLTGSRPALDALRAAC